MMKEFFEKLSEFWFLTEPTLFRVYCMHNKVENNTMSCEVRSGEGLIEYNTSLMKDMDFALFEETMRIEVIRILLKHPYRELVVNCSAAACAEGSHCVISDNYKDKIKYTNLSRPRDYQMPDGHSYETYSVLIEEKFKQRHWIRGKHVEDNPTGSRLKSKGEDADLDNHSIDEETARWHDDAITRCEINTVITECEASDQWGSLPMSLISTIVASTKSTIDYRKVLFGFRASILSSKRNLTRMRPNRRSGFQNMGSTYRLSTRLLVAFDVSCSIGDDDLENFYGVVNKFFKYGIEHIDCVQFDCSLGEVKPMHKTIKRVQITGRGGTDFQPVFDYTTNHMKEYDGLIIFTDGLALKPQIKKEFRIPVLWVLNDKTSYTNQKGWMRKIGRVCVINTRTS